MLINHKSPNSFEELGELIYEYLNLTSDKDLVVREIKIDILNFIASMCNKSIIEANTILLEIEEWKITLNRESIVKILREEKVKPTN